MTAETHPYLRQLPNGAYIEATAEAKRWRVANGRGPALVSRLPQHIPIIGVELGVNRGYLSEYLLRALPKLVLILVDTWKVRGENQKWGKARMNAALAKTEPYVHRRIVLRRLSLDAAEDYPDRMLDFVFIDADHEYESCAADIRAWQPKVRPGGLLCGHDVGMEDVQRALADCGIVYETGRDETWFRVK